MLGDHQFFVGRDDVDRNAAIRSRYLCGVPGILGRIECKAEPPSLSAIRVRIEAEFSPIPAVKTNASRPCSAAASIPVLEGDAVGEIIDRKGRARVRAGLEFAHIVTDTLTALSGRSRDRESSGHLTPTCPFRQSSTARRRGRAGRGRVPIASPSSAVKPMVLSTLFPPLIAHIEAPLPRWATMTRPPAISAQSAAVASRCIRRKDRGSRNA